MLQVNKMVAKASRDGIEETQGFDSLKLAAQKKTHSRMLLLF
jgi:hypothetical protein